MSRNPKVSYKQLRIYVENLNYKKIKKIIKSKHGDKLGNWLWYNIPTEDKYDKVFELLEKYYDVSAVRVITTNRDDCKDGIYEFAIGVKKWAR